MEDASQGSHSWDVFGGHGSEKGQSFRKGREGYTISYLAGTTQVGAELCTELKYIQTTSSKMGLK